MNMLHSSNLNGDQHQFPIAGSQTIPLLLRTTKGKLLHRRQSSLIACWVLVAQYEPVLLRKDVIKYSTSLSWIWQRIRRHYGFVQSEVNFLKLCEIKHKDNERYETFFQRILAHLDDNLLTVASNLQHDGVPITADEEMSPSTERVAV